MTGERIRGARTGQVVGGKYRLAGRLGKGGMGEVYEAAHTLVGRRFAIKFLHAELTKDEDMKRRFRREAKSAGSLESENIVAVTDFGYADEEAPYIVMEYLEGEDLAALLRRTGPLPVERAADLIVQACRGLHVAHAQRIVHRDLKPENLFITKRSDGSDLLKVLDFGIAKLRTETWSGVPTETGAVIGTLPYMPPEQLRGEKETDQRADVYALGAILYEVLTRSRPHPEKEPAALMYQILYKEPPPLESLRADVPRALAAAVHTALARDAGDRFQSAAKLAEALMPFADSSVRMRAAVALPESISVAPAVASPESETRTQVASPEPISVAPAAVEVAINSSPRKARGTRWAIGGSCALAVGVAALMWTLDSSQRSSAHGAAATRPEAGVQATTPPPGAPSGAQPRISQPTTPLDAAGKAPPPAIPADTQPSKEAADTPSNTQPPASVPSASSQGVDAAAGPNEQKPEGHTAPRNTSTTRGKPAPESKRRKPNIERLNPY